MVPTYQLVVSKTHIGSFIRLLEKADGAYVEWGIRKGAGEHPKAEMPVAELMAIHEFRDDKWRRPLFHIQAAKIADRRNLFPEIIENVARFLIQGAGGGRLPATHYLSKIGEAAVKDAKDMFGKKGISYRGMHIPENTEQTSMIKGHDRPLFELGVLKDSVTFTTKGKGG